MYFNFNNFRYWKGINNYFFYDIMKNCDKKVFLSVYGNILFIMDYYDLNKCWIKEIKKKLLIFSCNIGINYGCFVDWMKFWRVKVYFWFGEVEVIWIFIELFFGM